MKTSQRDAVYNAVTGVFADQGVVYEDGMNIESMFTKDMRESVHQILCEGFRGGTIHLEDTPANAEKLASESKLNGYVSGLISNWVRKDKRFNGGVTYVAKNPGSRAGQGDEQLTTLRKLKKQFAGTPKEGEIQRFIDARVEVLRSEKTKSAELTVEQIEAIPADLREKLGL
jgi:hypothetical protein